MKSCGEGGIRTLGTVSRTTVFETATIDRSATSPYGTPRGARAGGRKNNSFRGKFMNYPGLIGKLRVAGGRLARSARGKKLISG
jgi:hypothetical protein